jgi:acyl-[acyl-carrier-protein]-phospholipid O-acyltransferase/long-chain-fatty-acid--[acyl-carrier-protein] ligase
MKTLLRLLLRVLYGFRSYNTQVLKTPGPVLLIPNHVSWLDWLFLLAVLDEDWRFVVSSNVARISWLHRLITVNRRTFPVDITSPYAVRAMAEHLQKGGRLVIFAEGRISLSGGLMKLYEGTGFLLQHSGARVITCYLRGASRLPFVRHPGWTRWFPRVAAHFSEVTQAPSFGKLPYSQIRGHLSAWLRERLLDQQLAVESAFGAKTVLGAVAAIARERPGFTVLEDITMQGLSYRRLMMAVRLLASRIELLPNGAPDGRIGLLLPNVNAAPVSVLSLWAAGRVPAVLNFSQGVETMLTCARLAGLKQVLSSRQFLEKAKIDPAALKAGGLEVIYLEDLRGGISALSKGLAVLRAWFSPASGLDRDRQATGDTAVILFTSGSEGTPKGVELTHANLLANIRQGCTAMDLADTDRFFNAMPLFHSFGLGCGTLLPLVRGCYVFLYPSPLHYRIVPALVYDHSCTVLLGTNTFLNGYARKASAYDFCTLRFLVSGAEKVQMATFDAFSRKFGVRILEGYGATECSPIISLNTRIEPLFGSAGKLLPGMESRLEPVEGVEKGGRLFVRGPNIMKGYLNKEANAAFKALDGWYDTGDVVEVDEEGFLHILGRLKRFAKISGEMVSLTAIEEALSGAFPQYGPRCAVAIVAKPDADKGERLVAVCNDARVQLDAIRTLLRNKGLSNLCSPRELVHMQPLPLLGTGKTDHREILRRLNEASKT